MKEWKDNIYFVLVEPKEPGNVGASARAIKNMGFRNLCVVSPQAEMTDEGRWFARNAHDVLDSAGIYKTVSDAIGDKAIVVGTTRRMGKRRGLAYAVDEGVKKVFEIASADNKVAILFGREARGLFNEEVEECGFLLTIPSSKMQPSLNLSQAVLITAYELSKTGYKESVVSPSRGARPEAQNKAMSKPALPCRARQGRGRGKSEKNALINHEELTFLYKRITEILELLEYLPRGDRNLEKKIINNLKHFIGRAGLTDWELKMLYGICWQIEKKAGAKGP